MASHSGPQLLADLRAAGPESLGRRLRLRGHRRSLYPEAAFTIERAADDAAALLRALGVSSAIVVGYSLGTAVAQTVIERHQDLVDSVVLMGGMLAPNRRPHEKIRYRIGGWLGTAQRLSNGRWTAHRLVDKAARETPLVEHLRGWFAREMERGHVHARRRPRRADRTARPLRRRSPARRQLQIAERALANTDTSLEYQRQAIAIAQATLEQARQLNAKTPDLAPARR